MRHDSLVKAMTKAGHTIHQSTWAGNHFYVKSPSRIVAWFKQDDSAICVQSRRPDDENDSMSDYSAGYFCDTIKHAVASLSRD